MSRANSAAPLGVWLREARYPAKVRGTHGYGRSGLLASADLGFLLGRCSHVALREETEAVVLPTELVIQWRSLQVVTATPWLPEIDRLAEVVPGAHLDLTGFHVPLHGRVPEEVLADCLSHAIPVAGSRIIYCCITDSPRLPIPSRNVRALPVDSTPLAPIR
jgi:hypothetical protein